MVGAEPAEPRELTPLKVRPRSEASGPLFAVNWSGRRR
jgi:hypothetical protein